MTASYTNHPQIYQLDLTDSTVTEKRRVGKKLKVSHTSSKNAVPAVFTETSNSQLISLGNVLEDGEPTVHSKWWIPTPGSLQEYSSHTQDELRKIFETRRHREIRQRKCSEESESSEEEDNSDEKHEEKEGWKLLTKAIESKRLRAQLDTTISEG